VQSSPGSPGEFPSLAEIVRSTPAELRADRQDTAAHSASAAFTVWGSSSYSSTAIRCRRLPAAAKPVPAQRVTTWRLTAATLNRVNELFAKERQSSPSVSGAGGVATGYHARKTMGMRTSREWRRGALIYFCG